MFFLLLLIALGITCFPFVWRWWVNDRYATDILSIAAAPDKRVAIVFGARVYRNGRLSSMLRDRVDTAIDLYREGKVAKILVSGDNSLSDYNEPGAMMAYAIEQGVPASDIQPDFGGRRTYDTCYRAKHIFQIEDALLVTQGFHLPRALFICQHIGITVQGVSADRHAYDPRSVAWSEARETPALLVALLDVVRRAPPPVLGDPIPLE